MTDAQIIQFIGIIYTATGLSMLIKPEYTTELFRDLMDKPGQAWLVSMLSTFVGFLIVSSHPGWQSGWPLLVAIIGWAALIKGVIGLVFPRIFSGIMGMCTDLPVVMRFSSGLLLFGGIAMLVAGFGYM